MAAGAKVVVASRKAEACAETEAHLVGHGRRGARRADAPRRPRRRSRRSSGRTVDRFGRIDIVVNNAANALTQPLGSVHARGVGQVLRRQPARAGVPRAGGAAVPDREPARVGRQRDLGRRVPRSRRTSRCTPARKAGADVVHALDGRRVRAARHPGERARARHGRHRHGAQQPARGAGAMRNVVVHAAQPPIPTRWSARRCSSRPTRRSFMTGQCIIVDGGLTPH